MTNYTEVLQKVCEYAKTIGLEVTQKNFETYFKGDMDGINIWIDCKLDLESQVFDILHMIGHCIQWNLSEEKRRLGSNLYSDPDDKLLNRLQEYEWEANCYALWILFHLGYGELSTWLQNNYVMDMHYLTHFYKTGERKKEITNISKRYAWTAPLIPKEVPKFVPQKSESTRNGIVIDFKNSK